ncbi:MAG TPA: hypothetical protein VHY30_01505 [Verrucomicrobiae bacterium]|jgi:hypothetical protein|nr:hypothetical protein [Verrucomicrobiae bacterium]
MRGARSIEDIGDNALGEAGKMSIPQIRRFRDFLLEQAKVPTMDFKRAGEFDPFTFFGRESLYEVCRVLDLILGSDTGEPLKDSVYALCGGAQFGKTILELYLAAYITSQRFLNVGIYLPDDGLADGIVDMKFRPVVLDNIGWLSQMTQIGKAINKSGKSVNTKGAFIVTDGKRKASGMFRGLRKVPTTFSADVVIRDEEDDIPRDKAKFLAGRMTASQLRLQIIVGTMRVHGAGQNKQFEDGSQGVRLIGPVGSKIPKALVIESPNEKCLVVSEPPKHWLNPEEAWPKICRVQLGANPSPNDPRLTFEGDFRRAEKPDEVVATYLPGGIYYYADPETGAPFDPHFVAIHYRRPDRIKLHRWSLRVAQIGTAAIDLSQIVAHWTRAVMDDEEMISFCCDRKAMPKSAAQSLSPQSLQRSRDVRPFDFGAIDKDKTRVAGLDTGNRCWLFTREIHSPAEKRCVAVDKIALGDMVARVQLLWAARGLSALFIDENPAVDEARTLALIFNGLSTLDTWPRVDWNSKDSYVSLPGGLVWDGRNQRWQGLKCAVVRFSKRNLGMGIEHGAVEFTEAGQNKFVPMIACNRFESIDRVVKEFLTPAENVLEVVEIGGRRAVRQQPSMLLPRRVAGSPGILETLDVHLLTGSQRAKEEKTGELGDYVDKCENHFLLADAYSGLAEGVATFNKPIKFAYTSVKASRAGIGFGRGGFAL